MVRTLCSSLNSRSNLSPRIAQEQVDVNVVQQDYTVY